jgi:biliverdin reductase
MVSDGVRVGMVGTGFVARLRAEALSQTPEVRLVAVAGQRQAETQLFADRYGATALPDWQTLVHHPDLDLIMVCHINSGHGEVVRAALEADRHVVVEYPLALDADEAAALIALAQTKRRLLHVEHIELLGGTHRALKAHLAAVGQPHYARYCTLSPKHPAPRSWTYSPELFGFPLVGALSRLHRLIDCFGPVARVYCQNYYGGGVGEMGKVREWGSGGVGHYRTCLCTAQLTFASGLVAEVTYGKGEGIWQATRQLEVWGDAGALYFDGDEGRVVDGQGTRPIEVGSRRGLFATDTAQVIDHLLTGQPLYCQPEASLYTLRVAIAAQQSAATGQAIHLS